MPIDAVELVKNARRECLQPPEKLTVSEWADQYRVLSPESSAETGRWRTSRAEYMREVMDAFNDPTITTIVLMFSAQTAKTEGLNNCVGYAIDKDPAPILMVQPTDKMMKRWSLTRFSPMVRDTEPLEYLYIKDKKRTNTISSKEFHGGYLLAVSAGSASDVSGQPIRFLFLDEVDRFEHSLGDEGDPIQLAIKRTTTFWNKKIWLASTPTIVGVSRIAAAFDESDKRYFMVPCHSCGWHQRLTWSGVRWDEGQPDTAKYRCEACDEPWNDAERWKSIRQGHWKATETHNGTAGFHVNEIYSSWVTLADMAANFLKAKHTGKLQEFTNLSLGEPWEEQGKRVDEELLIGRCEDYDGEHLPIGCLVLTAGVDVQDDRLEVDVVAWGKGDESWNVDYKTIYGAPSNPDVWRDLDAELAETYIRQDGAELKISVTAVDSGGHFTNDVYRYCASRVAHRIFAIKGVAGTGKPIIKKMRSKAAFLVGVDTAKERLYSHLQLTEVGAGYCHFPQERDEEYFLQLTAEKSLIRYNKGFSFRYWKKIRKRNEALDCRVYAMAAKELRNPNYDKLEKNLKPSKKDETINKNEDMNPNQRMRRKHRKQKGYNPTRW